MTYLLYCSVFVLSRFCTVPFLYCPVLYCPVLVLSRFCTVPVFVQSRFVLSRFVLSRFVLSRFILSRFVLSRFILSRFCTVPFCTVPFLYTVPFSHLYSLYVFCTQLALAAYTISRVRTSN